jgi:hypothetical protein
MGSVWSHPWDDKRRLPIYVFRRNNCGINREWVLVLECDYDPYFHISFYEIPDGVRDGITADIWTVYRHPTVSEADEQVLRQLCFHFANARFHSAMSSDGDTGADTHQFWMNDKKQTHCLTMSSRMDDLAHKKKRMGCPQFVRPM